jgi:OmpA-OmpF porin, OOP family
VKTFAAFLAIGCFSASAATAGYEGGQFGANRWPNWYVGVSGAMPFVESTDVNVSGANIGELSFDNDYGVGASVGYTPGPNGNITDAMRFEFEYFYRSNGLDSLSNRGGNQSLSGDLTSDTYMVNAYYDINTHTRLTPYVGVGAGLASVNLEQKGLGIDDTDSRFAYQVMAGLGWQPEMLLNTVLQVGYKFMDAGSPEFNTRGGRSVNHDYQVHNIEAGARFRF